MNSGMMTDDSKHLIPNLNFCNYWEIAVEETIGHTSQASGQTMR